MEAGFTLLRLIFKIFNNILNEVILFSTSKRITETICITLLTNDNFIKRLHAEQKHNIKQVSIYFTFLDLNNLFVIFL